ncbi:MAG: phosphorylase [Cyanobacteria bacterium P01_H01_bin.119]
MERLQPSLIRTILVPSGPECWAVKRGLKCGTQSLKVIEIPAGPRGVLQFLNESRVQTQFGSGGILLMGLGGSLNPSYRIGDGVLLQTVVQIASDQRYSCDRTLTHQLAQALSGIRIADGISSDRVVTQAKDKQTLGDRYLAAVVDMESAPLLRALPKAQIAILRVVSDECQRDLPDISDAIDGGGRLRPGLLATKFIQRPTGALRLIRGSLRGLAMLQAFATQLTLLL